MIFFIITKVINHIFSKTNFKIYVLLYESDTDMERKAVRRAFQYSSRREFDIYQMPEPEVTFELITPEDVPIGNAFDIKVKLSVHLQCASVCKIVFWVHK